MTAEGEAGRHDRPAGDLSRGPHDDVDGEGGVDLGRARHRGHQAVAGRDEGDGGLDRPGGADQVTGHALGRRHRDGARAAAEFNVHGTYKATDSGLPEAKGQTYVLPAGTFFAIRDGKIARVTTYYNLTDWIAQVSG